MKQFVNSVFRGQVPLIRRLERPMLQLVSLLFSFGSAHAIQWFLAPLDSTDPTQVYITNAISIGLGILGYFVTRGLAHRLMQKESVLGYIPLVLVVEFVEIYTNFAKAQVAVQDASWLQHALPSLASTNIVCTYLLYCVVPLVGPCLAVLDMDLERRMRQAAPPAANNGPGMRPVPNRGPQPAPRPNGQPQPVPRPAGPVSPPPGVRQPQAQPQPVAVP